MRCLLVAIAILFATPALADNPARSPPPEFYSERPVKGERVVKHKSPESLLSACRVPGGPDFPTACYNTRTRTINVYAVGVHGTTVLSHRCDKIHERGHYIAQMKGKQWNHEGERFCK